MIKYKYFYILITLFFLTACGSVSITDYQNNSPTLIPEVFYNGKLKVTGIVQDRKGKLLKSFTADIDAHWDGNTGTLDEIFYFSDGEQQTRVWTLIKQQDGTYTGTAGDVVGEAIGEIAGNAMHLIYTLRIPYKGDTIDVKMDDWMYLVTPNKLINKTTMRKYGFKVGEILLTIEKE